MKPKHRVIFAHTRAFIWLCTIPPALLWWHDSVLFVILASIYANIESGLAAAEAADDSQLLAEIKKLRLEIQQLRGEVND